MTEPQLSVFVANHDDYRVWAGVDDLVIIIDHPAISYRSLAEHTAPALDQLSSFIREIQAQAPQADLQLNVDVMMHDRDLLLMRQAVEAAVAADVHTYRVQDVGVATTIKEMDPQAHFWFCTETGTNNHYAIEALNKSKELSIVGHSLGANWTADTIQQLQQTHPDHYEVMVHGPLLIQFTDRHLISGHEQRHRGRAADTYADSLRKVEVEGRKYTMYDNKHGTSMYAPFDRCLLRDLGKLHACQLSQWLIDTRGRSQTFAEAARDAWLCLRDDPNADPRSWWEHCQTTTTNPLKPGFFRANNTDHIFEDKTNKRLQHDPLAIVMDSIRDHSLTLRAHVPLACDQDYRLLSRDGREKHLPAPQRWRNLAGEPITEVASGELFTTHWYKGMVGSSVLLPGDSTDQSP